MAFLANRVLIQSFVGIRSRAASPLCILPSFASPFSSRFKSTQVQRSPISAQVIRKDPIIQPLQSRHSSSISLPVQKQDWRLVFRKAYYGTLHASRSKTSLPQPSHITSPEDSPLYSAWTHPLFIWGFVAFNGAVLLAYTYADHISNQGRPAFLNFINTNFTANYHNGKYWTLVTYCFTHENLFDYPLNMLGFIYIAPPLVTLLGPVTFLGVYIGAGAAAGVISIFWNKTEYKVKLVAAKEALLKAKGKEVTKSDEMTKGYGAVASQIALASILAMVDSRSKMLFIVFPVYTRLLLPFLTFGVVWANIMPSHRFTYDAYMDPSYCIGPMLFGLLYWRTGLRGRQFA